MADVKIYLSEELEEQFKRRSMETYGYGRGSISKAGAEAIEVDVRKRCNHLRVSTCERTSQAFSWSVKAT